MADLGPQSMVLVTHTMINLRNPTGVTAQTQDIKDVWEELKRDAQYFVTTMLFQRDMQVHVKGLQLKSGFVINHVCADIHRLKFNAQYQRPFFPDKYYQEASGLIYYDKHTMEMRQSINIKAYLNLDGDMMGHAIEDNVQLIIGVKETGNVGESPWALRLMKEAIATSERRIRAEIEKEHAAAIAVLKRDHEIQSAADQASWKTTTEGMALTWSEMSMKFQIKVDQLETRNKELQWKVNTLEAALAMPPNLEILPANLPEALPETLPEASLALAAQSDLSLIHSWL